MKRTIQRNWEHRTKQNKQKHNTICVGHHYTQTHTHRKGENIDAYIFARVSVITFVVCCYPLSRKGLGHKTSLSCFYL
jgi:hypothetical protein